MKISFLKHPLFIIFAFFIAGYFMLQKYSSQMLSDEPVVLSKANPPKIVMYGSQSCMYCYVAKNFFEKHNLPYTEYDIERSEKRMKEFYILGGRGTPLVIINDEIIYGFDEGQMRAAL